ncbi:hypothetical protein GCM10008994_01470 [Halorubrum ejinorense]|uniref:Uncharacterized protein n=1 Tax=Halorubrum ejinorense TaxID=425309 RepID=A0AAV3SLZ4_9EURY
MLCSKGVSSNGNQTTESLTDTPLARQLPAKTAACCSLRGADAAAARSVGRSDAAGSEATGRVGRTD